MLRLLTDADVHGGIVAGLRHHRPTLDLVRAQEVGLRTAFDPAILAWAAHEGRIVLSQDRATMVDFANTRVANGESMPGLFVIRKRAGIGEVIQSILFIDEASTQDEWRDKVQYIPL
jgi:predicted nuclease of predicted toxin-antitoxin system